MVPKSLLKFPAFFWNLELRLLNAMNKKTPWNATDFFTNSCKFFSGQPQEMYIHNNIGIIFEM